MQAATSEPEHHAPPSLAPIRRSWWWFRNATTFGLVMSLLLHLSGISVAGFVWFGGMSLFQSAPPGGGGGVEMAVMTEGELGQLGGGALGDAVPSVPQGNANDIADVKLSSPPGDDAATSTSSLGGLGNSAGGGDVTAGPAGGLGPGSGGGGGGGASFFGVEAQGNRFAYIVDVSGSMDTPIGSTQRTRIQVLRGALAESISAMIEGSSFAIMLFSSGSQPLIGGSLAWVDASDKGKQRARRAIAEISAGGSTEPLNAFKQVLQLKPRPDAVYFMTDGDFDEGIADEIAKLNVRPKIKIHCICFVERGSEARMKQIAKTSGGVYTFVDGVGR